MYQFVADITSGIPEWGQSTLYYCREQDRYQIVSYSSPLSEPITREWDGEIFRKKHGEDFRNYFHALELQRRARGG